MNKITVNANLAFEFAGSGNATTVNGDAASSDIKKVSDTAYHLLHQGRSYNIEVISFDKELKTAELVVNNNVYHVEAKDQFDQLLEKMGLSASSAAHVSNVKAPMPGLVLQVFVEPGMKVKKGDNLLILEAMKMENIIKSPADGVVTSVGIKQGEKVEKGAVLIAF